MAFGFSVTSVPVVAVWLSKSDDFGLPGRRKTLRSLGYLADYTRLPGQITTQDQVNLSVYGEGDVSTALVSRDIDMDDGGGQHRLLAAGIMERPQTRFQVKLTFKTAFELLLKEVKFNTGVFKRLTGQPQ